MDYFYVDISTELGESLTTYVQAMDETAAEYQARMAFVNGELECEGTQIVYICAYRADGKQKSPYAAYMKFVEYREITQKIELRLFHSLVVRWCTAKVHSYIIYFGGML